MDELLKFSDFVSLPLKFLKVIGFSGFHKSKESVSTTKIFALNVYQRYVVVHMMLFLSGMLICMIQNIRHLPIISEVAPGFGVGLMAISRLILIPYNEEEFRDLMKTLHEMFPKRQKDQKDFDVRNHYIYFKLLKNFLVSLLIFAGIADAVAPIIKFVITGVWINKMPTTWFPFDEYDPRYYNFVLIWHLYSAVVIGSTFIGSDIILIAFISMISMQFDILCKKLENLNGLTSFEVRKMFSELVKTHQTLIRLAENLEKIFSIIILINIIESSVMYCFIAYQLSIDNSIQNYMKYGVFLTVGMMHTFILCYYGNKLASASEKVAQAAYNSKWEFRKFHEVKSLALMMQRSQRPCVLTAYKFFVVSLEIFSSVGHFV